MEPEFKEINTRKADHGLIKDISELRDIPVEKVYSMMRYNLWTPQQFANLTGKSVHTINNLTIQGKQVHMEMVTAVNIHYPFPNRDTLGPKFIIRDDMSMEIIRKSLK